VVEDRDPVGELVRLLQVLGGEEDRDADGHEVADDLPRGPPAARVEAGGRLVEEEDPRVADQAHRKVEPAPHAAGVGRGRLPGRVEEIEPPQQFGRAPPPCTSAQVVQVRHQDQVLLAGEQVVDRGELAGDADRGADRIGISSQIMTGDPHVAAVEADQRRQDLHRGGLAGAVGAEQREDRPAGNMQVDAVQHHLIPERLPQPDRRDGRLDGVGSHEVSVPAAGFTAVSQRLQVRCPHRQHRQQVGCARSAARPFLCPRAVAAGPDGRGPELGRVVLTGGGTRWCRRWWPSLHSMSGASNGNQKMVTKNSWQWVVRKSVARRVMVWSCRSVCRSASAGIGCWRRSTRSPRQ
jgi:hypothetical protein